MNQTVTEKKETEDVSSGTPAQPTTPAESGRAQPESRRTGHNVFLRDLNAFYGEQQAVKNIDLDFRSGEVTAIIGPSGCGKSTMVRCINRMHEEIPGPRAASSSTTSRSAETGSTSPRCAV
jgi:phosphate transport system ATP-binding protein